MLQFWVEDRHESSSPLVSDLVAYEAHQGLIPGRHRQISLNANPWFLSTKGGKPLLPSLKIFVWPYPWNQNKDLQYPGRVPTTVTARLSSYTIEMACTHTSLHGWALELDRASNDKDASWLMQLEVRQDAKKALTHSVLILFYW